MEMIRELKDQSRMNADKKDLKNKK